jgi:hypothetical protein
MAGSYRKLVFKSILYWCPVKQKSILVETSEDMKIKLYALKLIFDTRWAATQESALKSIVQTYVCMRKTFSTLASTSDEEQLEEKSAAADKLTTVTIKSRHISIFRAV